MIVRGLLAEFSSADQVLEAARKLRRLGYRRLDAFTPYPVEALEEVVAPKEPLVAPVVLVAGLFGGLIGYLVQWWTNGVDMPLNVGGFPPHSPPAFIPATFETTVLFASATAFLSVFFSAHLPRLWHPLFEVEGFDRATVDRFFLWVDAEDARFAPKTTRAELEALVPLRIEELGGPFTVGVAP